jgi:hypothetical protein
LRFLALLEWPERYERPMVGFLNNYMATNREIAPEHAESLRRIFRETTDAILEGIGPRAFRPRIGVNAAVMDSVLYGVARRIQAQGPVRNPMTLAAANEALQANPEYKAAVESTTSYAESVRQRLTLAEEAFSSVK